MPSNLFDRRSHQLARHRLKGSRIVKNLFRLRTFHFCSSRPFYIKFFLMTMDGGNAALYFDIGLLFNLNGSQKESSQDPKSCSSWRSEEIKTQVDWSIYPMAYQVHIRAPSLMRLLQFSVHRTVWWCGVASSINDVLSSGKITMMLMISTEQQTGKC